MRKTEPLEDEDDDVGRVLSLQSHVVHGYVGNKSAVFPLQLLGFDVDIVNTVQFSNHTGYASFTGEKLDGDQLCNLMDGLDANDLMSSYTHLLTGYAGTKSFVEAIVKVATRLKSKNPDLVYVCDPVLGDNNKLYVPKELVKVYSEDVVPLANVLLPNQFEAELLSGIKIECEKDALKVCETLHDRGPSIIVITSLSLTDDDDDDDNEGEILMLLSHREKDSRHAYIVRVPRLDSYFTGTGDLTAALMLGYLGKGFTSNQALEMTASSVRGVTQVLTQILRKPSFRARTQVHAVLRRTCNYEARMAKKAKASGEIRTRRPSRTVPPPELRLIQSRDDLLSPPPLLRAVKLL